MNEFDKIQPTNTETINPILDKELKDDAEIRNLWLESIHYRDKRQTFNKTNKFYDFIIVGAGTAGCVLARELIHNIPNINILVLEAGPTNTQVNDIMRIPSGFYAVNAKFMKLIIYYVVEFFLIDNLL